MSKFFAMLIMLEGLTQ